MPTPPLALGPTPPYSNPPIEPQFFQPSRFVISDISEGSTTVVTTSTDHNYVVGQLVRLLIPKPYGAQQLTDRVAYVISIPSSTQVTLDINSRGYNAFVTSPFVSSITGASQTNPCVLNSVNNFIPGQYVVISGVSGMVELNGHTFLVVSSSASTLTINVDASLYAVYSGGGSATITPTYPNQPQIIAIGDVNSGKINLNGRMSQGTVIPGSFINISP